MTRILTPVEQLKKYLGEFQDFNWEELLEPYREGGTKEHPIRRTWGTLLNWLVNKLKFDIEVAGAAVLILALELKNGKSFEGDGSYGSKGDHLAKYLRSIALNINNRRMEEKVFSLVARLIWQKIEPMIASEIDKKLKPWYKRIL